MPIGLRGVLWVCTHGLCCGAGDVPPSSDPLSMEPAPSVDITYLQPQTPGERQNPFKIIDPLPLKPPEVPGVSFPIHNAIDAFIADRWCRFDVEPMPLAEDLDFVRRVHLDLVGRLPTLSETRQYLAMPEGPRAAKLVDQLLDSSEYADAWSHFWGDLLLEKARIDGAEEFIFKTYIRDALQQNKPYDQWVWEMITAQGMARDNPAASFILRHRADPVELTIATSDVFLGTQLKCAQCHDHPTEPWLRSDFDGMRRFWEKTSRSFGREDTVRTRGDKESMIFLKIDSEAGATGRFVTADTSPLGGGVEGLADLVTSRNNPYFARVAVNRLWGRIMGQGLVDLADGFSVERPPSHPELLDWLALEFIAHQYDLKHIIRLICTSRTYRLSTGDSPMPASTAEGPFFERMPLKRLTAEQLHDSILVITGHDGHTRSERRAVDKRYPQSTGNFLPVFGSHDRSTFQSRNEEATIPQALELLNGDFINRSIRLHPDHPLKQWKSERCGRATMVSRLFMQFLTREPAASEQATVLGYLKQGDKKRRWTDVQWALINTSEFMFTR